MFYKLKHEALQIFFFFLHYKTEHIVPIILRDNIPKLNLILSNISHYVNTTHKTSVFIYFKKRRLPAV